MTLFTLFREGERRLREAGIEDARFDCDCLFEQVFERKRPALFLRDDTEAAPPDAERFFALIDRRCAGEPLQYILGSWDFYDRTFFVGSGVLIPRPETETLVDIAAEFLRRSGARAVFDLCTGSGCIGLTLASHFPDSRFYLFDISETALAFAERNREKYALTNVRLFRCDIADGYPISERLPAPDILLSNPPYVPTGELSGLQRELSFEPPNALDGGEDGLVFYRILAEKWLPYLEAGGLIAVETGEGQTPAVRRLFEPFLAAVECRTDLFGVERFVCGRRRADDR